LLFCGGIVATLGSKANFHGGKGRLLFSFIFHRQAPENFFQAITFGLQRNNIEVVLQTKFKQLLF
jgi:hypothetical protein